MTFDLHIRLDDQSPEAVALEAIISREHVSPEQAVRNLLKLSADTENYDHLFTHEAVADLRGIATEMESGGPVFSSEQIREHFANKRQAWLAERQS